MTERWLGGTLTNFKTIRNRVYYLEKIEKMEEDGTFDKLPKKEVVGYKKEYEKLNKNLCGIREMDKLPGAVVIVVEAHVTFTSLVMLCFILCAVRAGGA